MEAKQVAQQEAERARFVVEKVSVQPDGRSLSPLSPVLGLPVCWVAWKFISCHLSFRDHRKGIEGTVLLRLVPECLGASQGVVKLCSEITEGSFFFHFPKIRNILLQIKMFSPGIFPASLRSHF